MLHLAKDAFVVPYSPFMWNAPPLYQAEFSRKTVFDTSITVAEDSSWFSPSA